MILGITLDPLDPWTLDPFSLFLIQFYRDQLGDAHLFHGDTVKRVSQLHGAFVVGDEDDLIFLGHISDHLVEPPDIGVVQGSIHFVHKTEGAGVNQVKRKD